MPVRPATSPTAAQESARLLLALFDQSKTERRPFKDEDEDDITIPPDGVLDRGEFPSAKFDMIDRLELQNDRISQKELELAIAKLGSADQDRILKESQQAYKHAEGLGKRFMGSFASFGLGGLALVGGLIFGGVPGLVIAGLGGLGIAGGFGMAVKTIIDGNKAAGQLFKSVDAAFSKLS